MREDKFSRTNVILYCLGLIPTVWLGLLVAPTIGAGLPNLIRNLAVVFSNPFHIVWCEDSVKAVLIFICAYAMGIGIYLSTARNYRRREEHGSAHWGNAGQVNKKYENKAEPEKNKILTQKTKIGLDGRKHRRNLNVLVCGGSGAGKTRFYAKPNIMQANTSFVILDPKGENVRDTGSLLKAKGYDIKVLDRVNLRHDVVAVQKSGLVVFFLCLFQHFLGFVEGDVASPCFQVIQDQPVCPSEVIVLGLQGFLCELFYLTGMKNHAVFIVSLVIIIV